MRQTFLCSFTSSSSLNHSTPILWMRRLRPRKGKGPAQLWWAAQSWAQDPMGVVRDPRPLHGATWGTWPQARVGPWTGRSHHCPGPQAPANCQPAPWLAELDRSPWASTSAGEQELVAGVRAELPEDSLSLEMLRKMLLCLLFTRTCVTEVSCPFISHIGFFEKKGFHRQMRGSWPPVTEVENRVSATGGLRWDLVLGPGLGLQSGSADGGRCYDPSLCPSRPAPLPPCQASPCHHSTPGAQGRGPEWLAADAARPPPPL